MRDQDNSKYLYNNNNLISELSNLFALSFTSLRCVPFPMTNHFTSPLCPLTALLFFISHKIYIPQIIYSINKYALRSYHSRAQFCLTDWFHWIVYSQNISFYYQDRYLNITNLWFTFFYDSVLYGEWCKRYKHHVSPLLMYTTIRWRWIKKKMLNDTSNILIKTISKIINYDIFGERND